MIAVPQGFTVVPGGERVTLVPAGGAQLGLIRYKERVRPLARLGEIVPQQLAAGPGFQLARRGTPYSYTLALKVDDPDDREYLGQFVEMARSIQAVPAGAPAVHTLVRHWWN